MDTSPHDPRIDPRPGDSLEMSDLVVFVDRVEEGMVSYRWMTLSAFRRGWMSKARENQINIPLWRRVHQKSKALNLTTAPPPTAPAQP